MSLTQSEFFFVSITHEIDCWNPCRRNSMIDAFRFLVLPINILKWNIWIHLRIILCLMLMILIMMLQYILHLYNIPSYNLLWLMLGEEERRVLWHHMQIKQIFLRKLQGNIFAAIANNLHYHLDLHYHFLNGYFYFPSVGALKLQHWILMYPQVMRQNRIH